MTRNQNKAEHFVKLPVGIIKVPESRYFLTSASGYIYFYLLSWAYHSARPAFGNYNAADQVLMAQQYAVGRLGVLSNYGEIQAETGYSKSTIESSLNKLESMKLIRKFPQGNLGTYFLLGSVDPASKVERTYLSELAEAAATPEGQAHLAGEFVRVFAPKKSAVQQAGKRNSGTNAHSRWMALYLAEADRLSLPPEFKHKDALEAAEECVLDVGEHFLVLLLETADSVYRTYMDTEEAIHLLQDHPDVKPQIVMGVIGKVHERLREVSAAAQKRAEMLAAADTRESAVHCTEALFSTSNIHLLGGKYVTEINKYHLINGR